MGAGNAILAPKSSPSPKQCHSARRFQRWRALLSMTKEQKNFKDRMSGRNVWRAMLRRCYSPSDKSFHSYGGRGITVCERWLRSWRVFMQDMGPRPSLTHQVDRIDNNGNYEPGNCRWATNKENNANRRHKVMIACEGSLLTINQWADLLGVTLNTAWGRYYRQRSRFGTKTMTVE